MQTNASIIRDIFTEVASTCPGATCCVVTNPVNSTLPIAAETLKKAGVFEPTRLFGITTLDVVRASTFAAHAIGGDASPRDFKVPVIGGHSGATILPLYSQAEPAVNLSDEVLAGVINRECDHPMQGSRKLDRLINQKVFNSEAMRSSKASKGPVVPLPAWHMLVSVSCRQS